MIYVLMASKTETDYQRIFEKPLQLRQHLVHQSIMADFEKATQCNSFIRCSHCELSIPSQKKSVAKNFRGRIHRSIH